MSEELEFKVPSANVYEWYDNATVKINTLLREVEELKRKIAKLEESVKLLKVEN